MLIWREAVLKIRVIEEVKSWNIFRSIKIPGNEISVDPKVFLTQPYSFWSGESTPSATSLPGWRRWMQKQKFISSQGCYRLVLLPFFPRVYPVASSNRYRPPGRLTDEFLKRRRMSFSLSTGEFQGRFLLRHFPWPASRSVAAREDGVESFNLHGRDYRHAEDSTRSFFPR